jgi:hypothetical protein
LNVGKKNHKQKVHWLRWFVLVHLFLEDGNVVIDLGAMLLSDALGYPNNIATLLLFEL